MNKTTAIGLIAFVAITLFSGCTQQEPLVNEEQSLDGTNEKQPMQQEPLIDEEQSLDETDEPANKDTTCSTENYATVAPESIPPIKESFFGEELMYVTMLTLESQEKLNAAIEANGSQALYGISTLGCLEDLFLTGESLSDISALSSLTNMINLQIINAPVSDISPLKNMSKLIYLNLVLTEVSDLTPISNLTNLRGLWLDGTNVSDLATIEKLMPNLEVVDLKGTQINPEDCKILQEKWYQKDIICPT